MDITFFLGGLSGGGTERVVCNLANYLAKHNHKIEIVTMSDDTPSYYLADEVRRVILLYSSERKSTIQNLWLRYKRLKEYMRQSKTELYIVMLPVTIIMLLAMKKFTDAPIVVSERGDPSRLSNVKQLLLKRLINRAKGCVFQTEDAKQWYAPYIGEIKTAIIPNAINEAFLSSEVESLNKKKVNKIVSVGRLTDQKNYGLLLKAFSKIHIQYPQYKLVIYGEGPRRNELLQQINEAGLGDYVDLPGYVEDIKSSIEDSKLFVMSSLYEGIPNSLIEAMAIGLPCISTDCPVGGPRSVIDDRINGLLVNNNNEEELISAISTLLSDEGLREQIGKKAVDIKKKLAPERVYGLWESFLLSILSREEQDGKCNHIN